MRRLIILAIALSGILFSAQTSLAQNNAPILAPIGAQSVNEGGRLDIRVTASDPDAGDIISLVAESLPTNATFNDSTGGVGGFTFLPDYSQAGLYQVRFIVSDTAGSADSELVDITVINVDRAPVLTSIGAQSVAEGAILNVRTTATDPDGDIITLHAEQLPANASFHDSTGGVGGLIFSPDYTQAGLFAVRIIATSNALADTELVNITVTNTDRAPVIAPVSPQTVPEGGHLAVRITSSDPDGDPITLSAQNLPANATFHDSTGGVGGIIFDPSYAQAGGYQVRIIATSNVVSDTELVNITVTNVDRKPVITPVSAQSVPEGGHLALRVTATDPDGDIITLLAQQLPTNAAFHDSTGGVGSLIFDPNYAQSGGYQIRLIANANTLADTQIVNITVTNVDRAPVFTTIGPRSVAEGGHLEIRVTAADPDGDIVTLLAQQLPLNSSFHDSTGGIGGFIFNPDYTQNGNYQVIFIANAGGLADTELVPITVTAIDRPPVIATVPPQTVPEGGHLAVRISATDPDAGDVITLTALNLPANASFVDSTGGRGGLIFDPSYVQAAAYQVSIIAHSNTLADTEIVSITVTNVDRKPVITPVNPQSVAEGGHLAVRIAASDPDGDLITLLAQQLPTNASFHDSTGGVGALIFDPNYSQAGPYQVRLIANSNALADTQYVNITVTNIDRAPTITPISPQTIPEAGHLAIRVASTDPDGDTITLLAHNLPGNAVFHDSTGGIGSLIFDPNYTQAGPYQVTIIANSNALADTELVNITVTNVDRAPVFIDVAPQSLSEGQTLNLNLSASDPDGDIITLTSGTLPANATFTDLGGGAGRLVFSPDLTQEGSYNLSFFASSNSPALRDTMIVSVTVLHTNAAPVLNPIGPHSINENQRLSFIVSASDLDGQIPTLTAHNLPLHAAFTDSLNGRGLFVFDPDYTQAGPYTVLFIASDGVLADSENVNITVNNVNRPPVLNPIGNRSVIEGSTISFRTSATDPDLQSLTLVAQNLPTNATFVDSTNGSGVFRFTPGYTQSGFYDIRFIASDGSLADSELVRITVLDAGNQAPVLDSIPPQTVYEGQRLALEIVGHDPDSTIPALQAFNLPANSAFADSGNGRGSFIFNPSFNQTGSYNVLFRAFDGSLYDSLWVQVTVLNTPLMPVLDPIGPRVVNEGAMLQFVVTSSDPDGSLPHLSASPLPLNATFADSLNGHGLFRFAPNYAQNGIYTVLFIASIGPLADSEYVQITVNDAGNQPPILAPIGPRSVFENDSLVFNISATDADGTFPILTVSGLPANASFVDNLNGTGHFAFYPNFFESGIYQLLFIASDGIAADSELVPVTVLNVNRVPVLVTIGPHSVSEGGHLEFVVQSYDLDGNIPVLSAYQLPLNASFYDSTNGNGVFNFAPDFNQQGDYYVLFTSFDGISADSELVHITVSSSNQPPVINPIPNQTIIEGGTLIFAVHATDADGQIPILTSANLPLNATFADSGNGTGVFRYQPDFTQSGITFVDFYASDGLDSDTLSVQITTIESGNQSPVLAPIGPQTVNEGQLLQFTVTASDADGNDPMMGALNLPLNANYLDHGNGTGTFTFNPSYDQAGVDTINFFATDGMLADSEHVIITVNNINRAPILSPIGAQTITEGDSLALSITASDPDGNTIAFSAVPLVPNMVFVDNLNGTANFGFRPNFMQSGIYDVTFITADSSLADSEIVRITVLDAGNQAPRLASIDTAYYVTEGESLRVNIAATDADGNPLALSAVPLYTNMTFVDNSNGTGTLNFHPNFQQAGNYVIMFRAFDGVAFDSAATRIYVAEQGNQYPVLAPIGPRTVAEGDSLVVNVSAVDPEGFIPFLYLDNPPGFSSFVDNRNGTGRFVYHPDYYSAGVHSVRFIAMDNGGLTDYEDVAITVTDVNRAPWISFRGDTVVAEGVALVDTVVVYDSTDYQPGTLSLTHGYMPPNATLTIIGNGIGRFVFQPAFNQAGVDSAYFVAVDSDVPPLSANRWVHFRINNVNRRPLLQQVPPSEIDQGDTLTLALHAIDPDGDPVTLFINSLTEPRIPVNSTFEDLGGGVGRFIFHPDYTQSGIYIINFAATDGNLIDTKPGLIQIHDLGNQPPTLNPIGAFTITEGDSLAIHLISTDPDSTRPALSIIGALSNMVFIDSTNGHGSLNYHALYNQAGVYNLSFLASDGQYADTQSTTLTVLEAGNQRPRITPMSNWSINEGMVLRLRVSSSDPDSIVPILTAHNMPLNSTLADSGNGRGLFTFSPSYSQNGTYHVTFLAIDREYPDVADSAEVSINVININRAPTIDSIGPFTVNEGANLAFTVVSHDEDATISHLTVGHIPPNASFVDNGDGTGFFNFNPSYFQAGVDSARFIAVDAVDPNIFTIRTVRITILNVNRRPILGYIPADTTLGDGFLITINFVATDPDSIPPILFQRGKPDSATFLDNNQGSGTLQWRPRIADIGTHNLYLGCRDRSNPAMSDSQLVVINVILAGNHPPIFAREPNHRMRANDTLNITLTATDYDGDLLTITSAYNLPFGMTLTDHGNNQAALYWIPQPLQHGDTVATLVATDPLGLTDSLRIVFTVITYIRGDANNSGELNGLDVIYLVNYFKGGPRPPVMEAADANGNGVVNGLDVVYLLNYFKGGPPPPLLIGGKTDIKIVPVGQLNSDGL